MNELVEKIITLKNGHYCHAFEGNLENFKNSIDALIDEFSSDFSKDTIIDFFETLEIYYLDPDNENSNDENALYNFNIKNYINKNYFL